MPGESEAPGDGHRPVKPVKFALKIKPELAEGIEKFYAFVSLFTLGD